MKRQDIAKLHHDSIKELESKIQSLQKNLVETRMALSLGKEKNNQKMAGIRTDIARIKTIISQKIRQEKAATK